MRLSRRMRPAGVMTLCACSAVITAGAAEGGVPCSRPPAREARVTHLTSVWKTSE